MSVVLVKSEPDEKALSPLLMALSIAEEGLVSKGEETAKKVQLVLAEMERHFVSLFEQNKQLHERLIAVESRRLDVEKSFKIKKENLQRQLEVSQTAIVTMRHDLAKITKKSNED